MGKQVELVDVLVEGGFGLNQEEFKELMTKYAGEIAEQSRCYFVCYKVQWLYCEEYNFMKNIKKWYYLVQDLGQEH